MGNTITLLLLLLAVKLSSQNVISFDAPKSANKIIEKYLDNDTIESCRIMLDDRKVSANGLIITAKNNANIIYILQFNKSIDLKGNVYKFYLGPDFRRIPNRLKRRKVALMEIREKGKPRNSQNDSE